MRGNTWNLIHLGNFDFCPFHQAVASYLKKKGLCLLMLGIFRWATLPTLTVDLANALGFSCRGIFNSTADGPRLFAKKFYFRACEEIGVNVQWSESDVCKDSASGMPVSITLITPQTDLRPPSVKGHSHPISVTCRLRPHFVAKFQGLLLVREPALTGTRRCWFYKLLWGVELWGGPDWAPVPSSFVNDLGWEWRGGKPGCRLLSPIVQDCKQKVMAG